MKFKTFLIVSLFLAILTIGAVSASEGNSTSDDVVAQENPIDVSQISQDSSDSAGIQEDSIYL